MLYSCHFSVPLGLGMKTAFQSPFLIAPRPRSSQPWTKSFSWTVSACPENHSVMDLPLMSTTLRPFQLGAG